MRVAGQRVAYRLRLKLLVLPVKQLVFVRDQTLFLDLTYSPKIMGMLGTSSKSHCTDWTTPASTHLYCEDILQLITDLFVVIDKVADAAKRFSAYGLKKVYPALQNKSETLRKITTILFAVRTKPLNEK